jgi:hypothetical protein
MAYRDYGYRDPRYGIRVGPEGVSDWDAGGIGLEPLFGYYRRGPLYATDFGSDYYGGGYGREVDTFYGGISGRTDRAIRRESYVGRGPRGYRRSDDRIREEINERLTRHPGIDASDIDVRVEVGEVTLTGVVEDRRAKRLAEDIAEDGFGVHDVHNELRIRHGLLAGLTGEKADEQEGRRATKRA